MPMTPEKIPRSKNKDRSVSASNKEKLGEEAPKPGHCWRQTIPVPSEENGVINKRQYQLEQQLNSLTKSSLKAASNMQGGKSINLIGSVETSPQ